MDGGRASADAAGPGLWPEGFRGAVALTLGVDAESVMPASDPSLAARAALMSHQRYGPQTGVPREVLAYAEEGTCCVITMYPFLSGRSARAKALGRLIDKIIQHGKIWLAPMCEITSRAVAANAATPGPGSVTMPFGQG